MGLGHDLSEGQRTQDVRISEDVSFDTMLLRRETLKGLKKAGFLKPSPIQLHGIPLGKCGFDLLLEAKSGTGKTAVFTVIALDKLDLNNGVQTIILAPTREIASQISSVITEIGCYYKGLNVAVVMGGLPVKDDVEKFQENVHIVVASPGRLRHLIHCGHIDVSSIRLFVLDEADKLMEKSFQSDINYIFSLLPKQKQVIMSSATYPNETKSFIGKYVHNAQHVCPDSTSVLLGIEQKVTFVTHHSNIVKQTKHRYEELKKILTGKDFKQCLIFCNYQVRVGELHRMLSRDKWPAEQLFGQQEQTDRLDALKTLQEYKCRILVSTDLAARGIDASNVDLVINFEPAIDWQTYLHRIGRAGRYGSHGMAISILSEGKEKTRFKETLAVTNMPFDLRDFWNNEPFNTNLNVTDSVEENTTTEVISSGTKTITENEKEGMLWNILTAESSHKNEESRQQIASFEVLCDSFKESSESSIESFSDLMYSFTINQNKLDKSNNFYKYRHIEVSNLPIESVEYWKNVVINKIPMMREFLSYNTEATFEDNRINRYPVSFQEETVPKEIEIHLTESMEKDIKVTKIQSKCVVKQSEEDICTLGSQTVDEDVENEEENVEKEIEPDSVTQSLIDAGLPTAFGKPKYKKSCHNKSYNAYDSNNNKEYMKLEKPHQVQPKPLHFQHNNRKEIKYLSSHKSSNTKKENTSIKAESKEFKSSSSDTNDDSDTSATSSETRLDNRPTIKSKREYTKFAPSSYNNANDYKSNSKKRYNISQAEKRSKEFDVWYNQLRSQTQFIQYALYIEELRKLK